VHVGVAGYGYWGPNVARNLRELPGCELTWVADLSPERLALARAQHPSVRTTHDYEAMLRADVDAVVVATPIRTHHGLARAALLAGKHVMVEKPLTPSSAEAADLIEIARARRLTLMVGHTFEYNPAIQALREIVASGEIGDVCYVHTARLNLGLFRTDINVLWDLAPHDLSILLYVLQRDPVAVSARGSATVTAGVHDVAYVELRFPGDVLALVHVSWLDPCKVRRVTLVGSKKMVVCDDLETVEKVRIYDKGVDRLAGIAGLRPAAPTAAGRAAGVTVDGFTYRDGEVAVRPVRWREPLQVQCEHFLRCIRAGSGPRSDGQVGLKVVRILERADASLRNGGLREPLRLDHLVPVYERAGAAAGASGRAVGTQYGN
jgi:predicted dehydrogenase